MSHWNAEAASFGDPILCVVACPALATLDAFSSTNPLASIFMKLGTQPFPPSLNYQTPTHLAPFLPPLADFPATLTHQPCKKFMLDTVPLFLPIGEELTRTVQTEDRTFLRTFFLPAHANLPIRWSWKLQNLTAALLANSVKALTPKPAASSYAPFLHILSPSKHLPWTHGTQ